MLKSKSRLTTVYCGLIITSKFIAYWNYWISVPGRKDRTFSGLHYQSLGFVHLNPQILVCKKWEEATEFLLWQKRFPKKWITLSFHKVLATKDDKDHVNSYFGRLQWLITKDTVGILEAELTQWINTMVFSAFTCTSFQAAGFHCLYLGE